MIITQHKPFIPFSKACKTLSPFCKHDTISLTASWLNDHVAITDANIYTTLSLLIRIQLWGRTSYLHGYYVPHPSELYGPPRSMDMDSPVSSNEALLGGGGGGWII